MPLHIDLHVNGNNTIVITNNLQEKQTKERSTGIGLKNIITRYSLVTNREVLINESASSFIVELPLITVN